MQTEIVAKEQGILTSKEVDQSDAKAVVGGIISDMKTSHTDNKPKAIMDKTGDLHTKAKAWLATKGATSTQKGVVKAAEDEAKRLNGIKDDEQAAADALVAPVANARAAATTECAEMRAKEAPAKANPAQCATCATEFKAAGACTPLKADDIDAMEKLLGTMPTACTQDRWESYCGGGFNPIVQSVSTACGGLGKWQCEYCAINLAMKGACEWLKPETKVTPTYIDTFLKSKMPSGCQTKSAIEAACGGDVESKAKFGRVCGVETTPPPAK